MKYILKDHRPGLTTQSACTFKTVPVLINCAAVCVCIYMYVTVYDVMLTMSSLMNIHELYKVPCVFLLHMYHLHHCSYR